MRIQFIAFLILAASCKNNPSIKGSWYTDSKDGRGYRDSVSHYVEIYVNDSIIRFHEEMMGQVFPQEYFIRHDTIFKCFGTGKDCEFIPMYKIDRITKDSVWLSLNPAYSKKERSILWLRLPKDEYGHFDLEWTTDSRDSLNEKVVMDYDRRREKYFATKNNRLTYYDSLLKAGTWDWNMKELREWEKANKPQIRETNFRIRDLPTTIPDSLKELFGDTTKIK